MKRNILSLAVLAVGAACFTGCQEDNPVDYPQSSLTYVTKGVYIINSGSTSWSIDGSLTYINYDTGTPSAWQNVFKMANGESLGGNPSDVLVYGEKVYIAGSDDNCIFVLRPRDAKMMKRIFTPDLMGESEGRNPCRFATYDGKVYFCTQGDGEVGYVAAIDTTDFKLQEMYPVGTCPVGMVFVTDDNNNVSLLVANKGWYLGEGTFTTIDLATDSITNYSYDKIKTPRDIAAIGNKLYVLDAGLEFEEFVQTEAGLYEINGDTVTMVVPDATGMTVVGNYIFTFNDPFGGADGPSYSIYDVSSKSLQTLNLIGDSAHPIISPSAIAFDTLTGNLFIASRSSVPEWVLFGDFLPDYGDGLPGFVNVYHWDGANQAQFIQSFEADLEPHKIEFFRGMERRVYW